MIGKWTLIYFMFTLRRIMWS